MIRKAIATYAVVALLLVAGWQLGVHRLNKTHPDWAFEPARHDAAGDDARSPTTPSTVASDAGRRRPTSADIDAAVRRRRRRAAPRGGAAPDMPAAVTPVRAGLGRVRTIPTIAMAS